MKRAAPAIVLPRVGNNAPAFFQAIIARGLNIIPTPPFKWLLSSGEPWRNILCPWILKSLLLLLWIVWVSWRRNMSGYYIVKNYNRRLQPQVPVKWGSFVAHLFMARHITSLIAIGFFFFVTKKKKKVIIVFMMINSNLKIPLDL